MKVRIHYPFHPLYGRELELMRPSSIAGGTALVSAPNGYCKQVPFWMLNDLAESYGLSSNPTIEVDALLRAAELLGAALEITL